MKPSRWLPALGLTLALSGLALAPARAADPRAAFKLALDRAGADPTALRALVDAEPHPTRGWFHAYVYDLVTPGIPDPERDAIRLRARIIADAFAERGDPSLRIVLDGERDGRLAAEAQAVRTGLDAIARPDGALLLDAPSSPVARGIIYGLLHRAAISQRAMGGELRAAALLGAARLAASAWFHLAGDATPWQAVEAWYGPDGIPLDGLSLVDSDEVRGIRAALAGQPKVARAALERARAVHLGQSGPGPRSTLMRGGVAEAMGAGDPAAALLERDAMLRELAAVGNPWLIARGAARSLEIRLARGDTALDAALRPLDPPEAATDPDVAAILLATADHLRARGQATIASDSERADTMLDDAGRIYGRLREAGVIDATVPIAEREAARVARAAAAARVDLARARLADARGRIDDAWTLALAARPALSPEDGPAADAFLGRLALDRGDLPAALQRTAAAEDGALPEPQRAANRGTRARVRLIRREAAPAFAWANKALRGLRAAGLDDGARTLRVELHRIAADALWLDGQREAAEQRLAFALGVEPTAEVALDLAGLQSLRGDRAAALRTLSRVTDPRAAVAADCVSAADPEAKRSPAALDPRAASPDPTLAARAAICRGWAKATAARADLTAARSALAGSFTEPGVEAARDPHIRAARHMLQAAVESDPARAQAERRAALEALRLAVGDGRPRIADHRPRAPLDFADVIPTLAADDWASVLGALAAADLAHRRWRPAPAGEATDAVDAARAALDGRLAAWSRAAARSARLDDPDRIAARDAVAATRAAFAATLAAQADAHPRWAAMGRPPIPEALPAADGPQWIYRVGPRGARLWVVPPGGKATVHALPDAAALRTLVDRLRPLLATARPWPELGPDPHAATWAALAEAAEALIPGAARPSLTDAPLYIRADGPLAGLPFEALVMTPPPPGSLAPPRFLASDRPVIYRGTTAAPQPRPASTDGPFSRIALAEADDEALTAAVGGAASTAPIERPAGEALTAGVAHSGGPIAEADVSPGALALLIVDGQAPPAPLLRWAGIGEVLTGPPGGSTPPPDARAVARLWGRLLARPARAALVFTPGAPGEGGALMPGEVSRSAEAMAPSDAVRAWRLEAMRSPARPGQTPDHHPAHWARWRRIAP